METIGEFVRRTAGPVVPFVPDWYPWIYAHHYLRCEVGQLPGELVPASASLSLDDARHLIEVWSGLTGERIEDSARLLADEYLRRWGLAPAVPAAGDGDPDSATGDGPAVAAREPRRRAAKAVPASAPAPRNRRAAAPAEPAATLPAGLA